MNIQVAMNNFSALFFTDDFRKVREYLWNVNKIRL